MSIKKGREAYTDFLRKANGTVNKDVWKVYDHLAADLMADCMTELLSKIDKDLDGYLEKVIYDEF